ncbi:hypothetical protein [Kibdelosporangium phytohabitans]|uniref:Uncharacterized protein n=1 Tax=Kibdelosporangium phytohabitans TaxID=860235 RepID=A0A0N9HRN8_9PSEU|nr:hypothetical protein [Kibdelosporangium phytohabitans]ALG05721.1 hypothetical protein AOZ06_01180 [Kibdelosporangium phytohabitans]MBE1466289.1 hypothetical protein [Kibdelosporangium phytohabitans]
MSELIASTERAVNPDHHMFGIQDRGWTGDSTPAPAEDWLGVGTMGVLIRVGEQLVSPNLRLEVWDGPPPDTAPGHEVRKTVELLLPTGELGVDEITGGWSYGLPDVDPGRYHVRITAWDREKTRADHNAIEAEWDTPEYERAAAALEGQERYLVQLWLAAPTARLVKSIALVIDENYPMFAFADEEHVYTTALPSPGPQWLGTTAAVAVVEVADQRERPTLQFELWDGPPPGTGGPEFPLAVPTGSVGVTHLRSTSADVGERRGGAIPGFFTPPPGDYRVRVKADEHRRRFTAQFWPATGT